MEWWPFSICMAIEKKYLSIVSMTWDRRNFTRGTWVQRRQWGMYQHMPTSCCMVKGPTRTCLCRPDNLVHLGIPSSQGCHVRNVGINGGTYVLCPLQSCLHGKPTFRVRWVCPRVDKPVSRKKVKHPPPPKMMELHMSTEVTSAQLLGKLKTIPYGLMWRLDIIITYIQSITRV